MDKSELLGSLAERLGLPMETAVGVPTLTLIGRSRLHVENHGGLIGYGPEEMLVRAGRSVIRLRGAGMELEAMTDLELVIKGKIEHIEYLE